MTCMLSNKTLLELIRLIEKLSHPEINRIIGVFNFRPPEYGEKLTGITKATRIFSELRYSQNTKGPFSNNLQLDVLDYLIDDFFRKHSFYERDIIHNPDGATIKFENAFLLKHKELANCLKRDGYTIKGRDIQKLLPQEIEEAKIESELFNILGNYKFIVSRGHLDQAIANHSQGNWAGANSQFRTFIESILMEITLLLKPDQKINSADEAIKCLAEIIAPPFLSKDLNEYPKTDNQDSFIYGFWKRLHPDGSHPGLSDEDDCSFRYHISIVFANYLLRRLAERKK